ncbi:MAG: heme-dependent oxidative N-demethylase subunit alpha family protein [Rubrivivax sp.]
MSAFDFDAAVQAPFRMQPGMRRLAAGSQQLTPLAPGSRHQREKLAVLSAFWPQALVAAPGFDADLALDAVAAHAAAEHPEAWAVGPDGRWHARHLATAVQGDGAVEQLEAGRFGLGDEIARCLRPLPAVWRRPALLALAFAEDLAVVDAADGRIPWIAACLPSHWAPAEKVGRAFAEVHAPVADNTLLLQASAALMRLASGGERWERFVWNVTDQPRLNAHPAQQAPERWAQTAVPQAWFRSERQTFIPVPGQAQAVFTILVDVQPLAAVLDSTARAQALHDAIASMSPAVLDYRGLAGVREPLLQWLQARAAELAAEQTASARSTA